MHIVSTVQYERRKKIYKMEGEPFTSSLNLCPEACCRKWWAMGAEYGITPRPPPSPPLFFLNDPLIFLSRRRNRYSPPRCFLHVCTV